MEFLMMYGLAFVIFIGVQVMIVRWVFKIDQRMYWLKQICQQLTEIKEKL
jgi:hypothetical protein